MDTHSGEPNLTKKKSTFQYVSTLIAFLFIAWNGIVAIFSRGDYLGEIEILSRQASLSN